MSSFLTLNFKIVERTNTLFSYSLQKLGISLKFTESGQGIPQYLSSPVEEQSWKYTFSCLLFGSTEIQELLLSVLAEPLLLLWDMGVAVQASVGLMAWNALYGLG